MASVSLDRLDPKQIEPAVIERLAKVLEDQPSLVGREGFSLPLPDPLFHLLLTVIQMMRKGEVILLVPEDETLTTKAAAEFLGVSRPFLIGLLEGNQIPFHNVGTHRRVKLTDLKAYRDARDYDRRKRLDDLFDSIEREGRYDDSGGGSSREAPENDD